MRRIVLALVTVSVLATAGCGPDTFQQDCDKKGGTIQEAPHGNRYCIKNKQIIGTQYHG